MSEEIVVVKTLQQQEISRVQGASAESRAITDESLKALKGQVVSARVLEVTPEGKAYLEIGGQILEVKATPGMQAGQDLLVKIEAIQPNLVLEILFADNKGLEKNLLAALKSILAGDTKLANGLNDLELKLADLKLENLPGIPKEVIAQLRQILSAINVKSDSQEVMQAIKAFINMSGINFEWQLANLSDEQQLPQLENNLKLLLSKLVSFIQKNVQSIEVKALPLPLAAQISELLESFKNDAVKSLPQEVHTRISRVVNSLLRSLNTTKNLSGNKSEVVVNTPRAIELFGNLQKEVAVLVADKSIDTSVRQQVEGQMKQLLQNLEARLPTFDQGRDFVTRLMMASIEKDAGQIREKLEAFQVLSSPVGDRPANPHLILPVSILNELTDVQIKQFVSNRKKGKEDSLTVVMLLELESLGKVRIDALSQEKALFVNVSVEKEEVVHLVNGMSDVFSKQLEARGMRLAKLVCKIDKTRIEDFHELETKNIISEQGLINLRV